MEKSKVYFSKVISYDKICEIFDKLDYKLEGNIAIKVHSGEAGNPNFLKPEFWKPIVSKVGGTIVECNTAYNGQRNTTEKHLKTIENHGWNKYFNVDLMDAEGPDLEIDFPNGKVLKKNYLGKNIAKYDSMLVLSHFKGHAAGGYGGALKQLSIGCASKKGKCLIHSAGLVDNEENLWQNVDLVNFGPKHIAFLDSMADAASSVVNYFNGKVMFINVMANLSVDCDCSRSAEKPCMKDIGVLASNDPVALDKACVDLIYNSSDPGKEHFLERLESRHGMHTIEAAYELGLGNISYDLIDIDEE